MNLPQTSITDIFDKDLIRFFRRYMDRCKGKLPAVNIYVSNKNFCHIFGNIPRSQANDFTKSSVKMICHFVITVVVIRYISFNSKSTSEC